jgi:hypothetical protein
MRNVLVITVLISDTQLVYTATLYSSDNLIIKANNLYKGHVLHFK